MKKLFLILLMAFPLLSSAEVMPVHHVVLLWLKPDTSNADQQKIIAETNKLADIPHVTSLHIGKAIPSHRSIVDSSFDIAIHLVFNNLADMNEYLYNERHISLVNKVIKPHLQKIIVYDF